jgi:hypothetical protein
LKDFTNPTLDVLSNDEDFPDVGEVLTIVGLGPLQQPSIKTPLGNAAIAGDGKSIIYTPDPGVVSTVNGLDTFSYTIGDGRGGTASVESTIEIIDAVPSDIGGMAYMDVNNNGIRDKDGTGKYIEIALAGIEVTLTGMNIRSQSVNQTLKTDVSGAFVFKNILPSANGQSYSLMSGGAQFAIDGIDKIMDESGDAQYNPGEAHNDYFDGMELGVWGTQGAKNNYMFGERGLAGKFISVAQYLSSTRKGLVLATNNMHGDQEDFWFSVLQGWDGLKSADVHLSADLATATLTVVNAAGQTQTRTLTYRDYYVAGDRTTGDYIIYFNGSAQDLGFGPLAANVAPAEGEVPAEQYEDVVDEVFASGQWA